MEVRFNEPLPPVPSGGPGGGKYAIALLAFIAIMGVICVLGEAGVFRK